MFRRSELAIWGGVVTGMDVCQSSETPLASLGEFLGRLRRLGWHPADVRAVELSILELLQWKITSANAVPVGKVGNPAHGLPSASGRSIRFSSVGD
jgi:hypothetical protein